MDFESFVTEFLIDLKNNNKNALKLLDDNDKLIQGYLGEDSNPKTVDRFVQDLENVVVQINKFNVIENVLHHKTMNHVYNCFKKSDVMVKAFKIENKNAVKWLQSMQISPYSQDEDGMNALMFAVQKKQWISYIKSFASDIKCVNQVDKYGRNALFYAVHNLDCLIKLMKYDIDINHRDCNGDTVLIYCCKNEIFYPFEILVKKSIDVNIVNNEGKNAAMYLALKGKYNQIDILKKYKKCDFNFVNEKGESVLSLLLKQMYEPEGKITFGTLIRTIISLVFTDCDFSMPLDEDENNALMLFLIAGDYDTFNFVLRFSKTVDLAKKNKYGENASSLFIKNRKVDLCNYIIKHPTFDINYTDPLNNNTILMLSCITQPLYLLEILNKNPELINNVNSKGENALIISCKSNNVDSVLYLLKNSINVNHKDQLGNTSLYYAVTCQNPIIVYHLISIGADSNLKNNQGKSANDLAHELGNQDVIDALMNNMTKATLQKITPVYKNKSSDINLFQEIKEYLYYCITNTSYSNFEINESMIKLEKTYYEEKIKQLIESGEIPVELAVLDITSNALFGLMSVI